VFYGVVEHRVFSGATTGPGDNNFLIVNPFVVVVFVCSVFLFFGFLFLIFCFVFLPLGYSVPTGLKHRGVRRPCTLAL
jgi:hypothetical protein